MHEEQKPGLDPDTIIDRVAEELAALRQEHEQRIGRALAQLHYYTRQRDKRRQADAARADRERGAR